LEVSIFEHGEGGLECKIVYVDTQNGMEQGLNRRECVKDAARALGKAVVKQVEKLHHASSSQ
jgi:hypothetical protein